MVCLGLRGLLRGIRIESQKNLSIPNDFQPSVVGPLVGGVSLISSKVMIDYDI